LNNHLYAEPKLLNVQGAQERIPPAYIARRAGASHRIVELGIDSWAPLKVYKFGKFGLCTLFCDQSLLQRDTVAPFFFFPKPTDENYDRIHHYLRLEDCIRKSGGGCSAGQAGWPTPPAGTSPLKHKSINNNELNNRAKISNTRKIQKTKHFLLKMDESAPITHGTYHTYAVL
jgi:hypothetical protein